MQASTERILVMEQSLRCFVFGLLGLIPGFGAAFGALSVIVFFKARLRAADQWNPARVYLNWGFGLATWGLFQSLVLVGWLIMSLR